MGRVMFMRCRHSAVTVKSTESAGTGGGSSCLELQAEFVRQSEQLSAFRNFGASAGSLGRFELGELAAQRDPRPLHVGDRLGATPHHESSACCCDAQRRLEQAERAVGSDVAQRLIGDRRGSRSH